MTPSSDGTKKTRLIGGGRRAEGAGGAFSRRWLTQRASGEAGNPGGRVPVLQMSSLRPQEGRWFLQGHPCSQQMMRPMLLCPLLPRNQMSPSRDSRAWLFLPREGETLGTPPPFPLPLLLPDRQCPQGGNRSRDSTRASRRASSATYLVFYIPSQRLVVVPGRARARHGWRDCVSILGRAGDLAWASLVHRKNPRGASEESRNTHLTPASPI